MPRPSTQADQTALYEAALEGLELQKQRLDEQIRNVRSMLGIRNPRAAATASASATAAPAGPAKQARKGRRRRNLSPEARKRIAEAQRKRWAAYRKDGGS